MSPNTILRTSLFASALIASMLNVQTIAAQTEAPEARSQIPKWFVLRHGKTGYCQTALLISIGGDYRSRTYLKAGGPYDTQEEAVRQKEALEAETICTKA